MIKPLALFLSIGSLALSQACVIPFIITTGIATSFSLTVQSNSNAALAGSLSIYDPGLDQDRYLVLGDSSSSKAVFTLNSSLLYPVGEETRAYFGFELDGLESIYFPTLVEAGTAADVKFVAEFACLGTPAKATEVLVAEGWGWCLLEEEEGKRLYLKGDDGDDACVDVNLVVSTTA
ncbi:hypothetical protein RUND412_010275 [Rhizina undulata]